MGILGLGVDIVSVARVKAAIARGGPRFVLRVFTTAERLYCERQRRPSVHFAGRLAAKEAVAKAFGTGIGVKIGWLDIQIVRHERTGAPSVVLAGRGRTLAETMGVRNVFISIAHTSRTAIAQALLTGSPPPPPP